MGLPSQSVTSSGNNVTVQVIPTTKKSIYNCDKIFYDWVNIEDCVFIAICDVV